MRRRGVGGLAVTALSVCALLAFPVASPAFSSEQTAELQQLLQLDQQQTGYPGEMLGVWQRGNGGVVGSAGGSNLLTGAPGSRRDHHKIGSVTKTFTPTPVLPLPPHGKLPPPGHIHPLVHR